MNILDVRHRFVPDFRIYRLLATLNTIIREWLGYQTSISFRLKSATWFTLN